MLDVDLAMLYGVRVRNIAEGVNRNRRRFPPDFLLDLTSNELPPTPDDSGGRKYKGLAFTAEGVAMLSTILQRKRAIDVLIAIVRVLGRERSIFEELGTSG